MSEKKPKSISHERSVRAYLTPRNYSRFNQFIQENNIGKSEGINKIVREFLELKKPASKHNY